jgi:tetratricopeptide (TPR) repeat protein
LFSQDMGRNADALEKYDEALRIQKAALGPDHHAVATTLNNIGAVHKVGAPRRRCGGGLIKSQQAMDNLQKGLEFYEQALRIRKAALGPDHHAVAATLNNIGTVHKVGAPRRQFAAGRADKSRQAMGNLPKALEYLEEALRINKAALGPDHHAVGATLNNIGEVYRVSLRACCGGAG